jgi:hypothetical protein
MTCIVGKLQSLVFNQATYIFSEMVSGGGKGRIPWARLQKAQGDYVLDEYLPTGVTLVQYHHICLRDANSLLQHWTARQVAGQIAFHFKTVTFPPHVTSTSAIEKGKWFEWRDTPERTDSSGSNGPVIPDLDLDEEESFIVGRLVSADVIEHETDHAPDYGDYGVMSGRLALS